MYFPLEKDTNSKNRVSIEKNNRNQGRMSYLIQDMDELHNVEMYVSIYVDVQMQTCQYINTNSGRKKKDALSTTKKCER